VVLVTGGAGYIGSHVVHALRPRGVVVLDDLSQGHRDVLPPGVTLEVGDVRDQPLITRILVQHGVSAVVHLAALTSVADSVRDPDRTRDVNVGGIRAVLAAMHAADITQLVAASSASVYGTPASLPIHEDAPLHPISPYGASKVEAEQAVSEWVEGGQGRAAASLRFFNAAGAHRQIGLGERHDPETHLIPLALRAAMDGRPFPVFGTDYPTPDGTCVRDYVHVEDLASAHVAVLDRLRVDAHDRFNVGLGRGYSVREVLRSVRRVTGLPLAEQAHARRPGDPAALVTDAGRLERAVGWTPDVLDLDDMVRSAWLFERRHAGLDYPGAE
jgi:UDP-glucose-4-epimerase GalE